MLWIFTNTALRYITACSSRYIYIYMLWWSIDSFFEVLFRVDHFYRFPDNILRLSATKLLSIISIKIVLRAPRVLLSFARAPNKGIRAVPSSAYHCSAKQEADSSLVTLTVYIIWAKYKIIWTSNAQFATKHNVVLLFKKIEKLKFFGLKIWSIPWLLLSPLCYWRITLLCHCHRFNQLHVQCIRGRRPGFLWNITKTC